MEKTHEMHGVEHAAHGAMAPDDRQRVPMILLKTVRFVLHFLEMCIVMCVSLGIFTRLALAAGAIAGHSNAIREFPVLSVGLLSIWFALIMIGWMRLRGHEWQMTLEMASTSLFAAVPLIGATLLGFVLPMGLTGSECGLACVFMVIAMLIRLDHYAGSHAGHEHPMHAMQT